MDVIWKSTLLTDMLFCWAVGVLREKEGQGIEGLQPSLVDLAAFVRKSLSHEFQGGWSLFGFFHAA